MNTSPKPFYNPRQNHLLAALSASDRERLAPDLKLVHLQRGQVLCDAGATPTHVYFPITAIVSLLHISLSGGTSEIAVVGNEGVVGMSLFSVGGVELEQTRVQTTGASYRLGARVAQAETSRSGQILATLLNYAHALMAQMAQTAIYAKHHSLEQQLCRRLLMGLDRLTSDEMEMTQQVLGDLLGVRRESVTNIALKLQQAGVIRYSRGHLAVLDRERLEQHAGGDFSPALGSLRVSRAASVMQCAA